MSYRGVDNPRMVSDDPETLHRRTHRVHTALIVLALLFGIAGTVMGIVALSIKQNTSSAAAVNTCKTEKVAVQGVCDKFGVSPTIGIKLCKAGTQVTIEVPWFNCDGSVNTSNANPAPLFIKLPPAYRSDANFGATNVPSYFSNVNYGDPPNLNEPLVGEMVTWCVAESSQPSQAYIIQDAGRANTTYLTMGWASTPLIAPITGDVGFGPCVGFVVGPYTATTAAPAQAVASMTLLAGAMALAAM